MPRRINGVGPRRIDERVYGRTLRRLVLAPLMAQLRNGLSEASAASLALEIIDEVFRRWRMAGLVQDEVAVHSARVSGYHKRRLIQTFRTALGIVTCLEAWPESGGGCASGYTWGQQV